MPYYGRHWALPYPHYLLILFVCVFQHRMALIHMAQGTPKPEDLMKSPDITQQTQLLDPAGFRRFLCPLLDHFVVSLIVSKRNSSILRGVQSQICTSEEVTLHQSPLSHGDIAASNTVEQSCFAECKTTWTEIVFAASEAWSYTALPRSSIFRDAPLQKALLAKSC